MTFSPKLSAQVEGKVLAFWSELRLPLEVCVVSELDVSSWYNIIILSTSLTKGI